MKTKTKTETIVFGLILVYLACYFMELFGFPDLLMLVVGAAFCLILLIKQKKVRIDIGLCLIAITMFSYCIIVFGFRAIAIMMPYIPVLMYVFAHYLVKWIKEDEKSEIKLMYIIYSLVFGHAVHGILNSCTYLAGYYWEGTRGWMEIWTGEYIRGTQLTFYFITVFAMFFPSLMYFKKHKWVNLGIIGVTLFLIYSSLVTRSRMTLLILILAFGLQTILYVIFERERLSKILTPKRIVIMFVTMVIALILLFFALKDNEIIRIFINNLGKDGGILNNIRFRVQRQALEQLFDYPMGGNQMVKDLRLCHNTWLDMADTAGLIPFFAFTAYTIWTIYELIRFNMKKEISTQLKVVFSGLYFAYFLYASVESVVLISVDFMTPWILIHGLMHGYLSNKE